MTAYRGNAAEDTARRAAPTRESWGDFLVGGGAGEDLRVGRSTESVREFPTAGAWRLRRQPPGEGWCGYPLTVIEEEPWRLWVLGEVYGARGNAARDLVRDVATESAARAHSTGTSCFSDGTRRNAGGTSGPTGSAPCTPTTLLTASARVSECISRRSPKRRRAGSWTGTGSPGSSRSVSSRRIGLFSKTSGSCVQLARRLRRDRKARVERALLELVPPAGRPALLRPDRRGLRRDAPRSSRRAGARPAGRSDLGRPRLAYDRGRPDPPGTDGDATLWSYSYGYADASEETRIARRVAAARDLPFRALTIRPYLFEELECVLGCVEGFQDVTQSRQAFVAPLLAEDADAVMAAHWGDVWLGGMGLEVGPRRRRPWSTMRSPRSRSAVAPGYCGRSSSPAGRSRRTLCCESSSPASSSASQGSRIPTSVSRPSKPTSGPSAGTLASIRMFQAGAFPRLPFYDTRMSEFFAGVPTAFVEGWRLQIDYSSDLLRTSRASPGRPTARISTARRTSTPGCFPRAP